MLDLGVHNVDEAGNFGWASNLAPPGCSLGGWGGGVGRAALIGYEG